MRECLCRPLPCVCMSICHACMQTACLHSLCSVCVSICHACMQTASSLCSVCVCVCAVCVCVCVCVCMQTACSLCTHGQLVCGAGAVGQAAHAGDGAGHLGRCQDGRLRPVTPLPQRGAGHGGQGSDP